MQEHTQNKLEWIIWYRMALQSWSGLPVHWTWTQLNTCGINWSRELIGRCKTTPYWHNLSRSQFSNGKPFPCTGFVGWFTQWWPGSESASRATEHTLTTDSVMDTLWRVMDSLLMMLLHKMNLFVSDLFKQMNLKSINIVTVVLASNAGFVFTFVLLWNGGMVIGRSAVGL